MRQLFTCRQVSLPDGSYLYTDKRRAGSPDTTTEQSVGTPRPLKRNLSETVYLDGGRGVTISDFSRCTVTSPGFALRGLWT